MANKKNIIILFALILSINKITAQPYDWLIKPGTLEWSALNTHFP
jgi:hypothetical protein